VRYLENVINFDLLKEYDSTLKEVLKVWQKEKSYSVDDTIQYKGNYLKCTTAGISGTTTLDFTGVEVGDTITDGTVVWELVEPPSGSGGTSIDNWTSGNSYNVDDLVIYSNKLYKCITDNSDSTFTPANWQKIGDSDFTGATSSADGTNGLVPMPTSDDLDKFLSADGTWKEVSGSGRYATSEEIQSLFV
jgi:hypothetical protein